MPHALVAAVRGRAPKVKHRLGVEHIAGWREGLREAPAITSESLHGVRSLV